MLRQSVFALAVGQVVAALLLGPDGGQPGGAAELLVTPAPWTFGIWGAVVAGVLAYGAYQLSSRRGDAPALQAVAPVLIAAQVGFLAWLVLAATAPVWTTVVVLAAMVAALVVAYDRALAGRGGMPLVARLLLLNTLGVFTAWSAVALPVNLASALAEAGLPTTGGWATAWQSVVLLVVAVVGVAVVLRWRARLSSTATVAWGLAGIGAGASAAGAPVLGGIATVGAVVFAGWALWWRWNDLRQRADGALRSMGFTGGIDGLRGGGTGGTGPVVPGSVVKRSTGRGAPGRPGAGGRPRLGPVPPAGRPGRGGRR